MGAHMKTQVVKFFKMTYKLISTLLWWVFLPIHLLIRALRYPAKVRFRVLGRAIIKNIPTEELKWLTDDLKSDGWRESILSGLLNDGDYAKMKLKAGGTILILEWDPWSEGSIEGPAPFIENLGRDYDMKVTYEWRWSEYDS